MPPKYRRIRIQSRTIPSANETSRQRNDMLGTSKGNNVTVEEEAEVLELQASEKVELQDGINNPNKRSCQKFSRVGGAPVEENGYTHKCQIGHGDEDHQAEVKSASLQNVDFERDEYSGVVSWRYHFSSPKYRHDDDDKIEPTLMQMEEDPLLRGTRPASSLPDNGRGIKPSQKPPRPNHFLAIRINNQAIHKKMNQVLDSICLDQPHLAPCRISSQKLHVTLFVFSIKSNEEMKRAKALFRLCENEIQSFFSNGPPCLDFNELGSFGSNVLFLKPSESSAGLQQIKAFTAAVGRRFEKAGIVSEKDLKNFKPHATIMKTSKGRHRRGKKNKIEKGCYQKFTGESFGTHCFPELEFLKMQGVQDDGYYPVVDKIVFPSPPSDDSIHDKHGV